jgi:hypothetical protein
MITDIPSTEEPKPSTASIEDPSTEKQNEPKPTNDDANEEVEDPTPGPAELLVQGETTSGESSVEKPTVGEETKEQQVAGETAVQTIGTSGASALAAMKANKKNQKKIDSSNIIKTPNVHDVLLGRGKPVSRIGSQLWRSLGGTQEACLDQSTNRTDNLVLLFVVDVVSKPRWKSEHATNCGYVPQAIPRIRTSLQARDHRRST